MVWNAEHLKVLYRYMYGHSIADKCALTNVLCRAAPLSLLELAKKTPNGLR